MDRAQAIKGLSVAAAENDTSLVEQIKHLNEAFQRYSDHADGCCPFNIGDMVTPRADSIYPSAGVPHKVLEIVDASEPLWADLHAGTTRDGVMFNIRVGVWRGGGMAPFWAESWCFEYFNGETGDE